MPAPGPIVGDPPVNLDGIYVPTPDYRVLSVHQTMRYPPDGRSIPTLETDFEIPGTPNVHALYIDNYAFTHADVLGYLRGRSKRIRRLYALPDPPPADPEEL